MGVKRLHFKLAVSYNVQSQAQKVASNKAYVGVMTYLEQPSLHAIYTNKATGLGNSPVH